MEGSPVDERDEPAEVRRLIGGKTRLLAPIGQPWTPRYRPCRQDQRIVAQTSQALPCEVA
jgi:hypothetical protein